MIIMMNGLQLVISNNNGNNNNNNNKNINNDIKNYNKLLL